MPTNIRAILSLVLFAVFVGMVLSSNTPPEPSRADISYSDFLTEVTQGGVSEVTIEGQTIRGAFANGETFATLNPGDPGLVGDLLENGVTIHAREPAGPNPLLQLLLAWGPLLLLVGVYVYFMRRMQNGGMAGGVGALAKSRARRFGGQGVNVTFADVAGADEAKQEVAEFVAFLRDPAKYRELGGNIPRGALLAGPPGTGKTLLAKAIAGEAGVPFFSISGSDFVEMFVGVGAARVRSLFKDAKQNAPCIIFIDEIDAVGRRRGAGLGGGHDEREQTLNQLLVEMDGFEGNEGVIVIAATNRPDVLDPALLRPGRFDRQVVVPLPDVTGREQILNVHVKKVSLGGDVDVRVIARGTPGFSGADLANLVNEAALFAARSGRRQVDMEALEQAKDKILMGAERRSMAMSEEDKRLTAYHEAGHAIVGKLVPGHDPIHKISIIPRGRALGVTLFLPERDRYSLSKRQLESQIATLFGGRAAEELVFGTDAVTTGAQNDIQRATEIARNMVTKWGFSNKLGALAYAEDEGQTFLGQPSGQTKTVSEHTARRIDAEVRALVEGNHARARRLLEDNIDTLHALAAALIQHETLSGEQLDDVLAGREPRPAGDRPDPPGSPERRPAQAAGDRPGVLGPSAGQHA